MSHSQGFSNNFYSEPNQLNSSIPIDTYLIKSIPILSSHLRLGSPKGLFPVIYDTTILEELRLPSNESFFI